MRNPWWSVFGSFLAQMTNSGTMLPVIFSLFINPLSSEFGWSRTTISAGFSISAIAVALAFPYSGYLMDRYGVKRVWLCVIALFAVAMAAISLATANPITFWALYAVAGLFGAGNSAMPAAKVVSGWFERRRGLALGIAMSGTGLGSATMPQLVRYLIEHYGWRSAYVGIGLTILLIGVVSVAIFVRNPPETVQQDTGADGNVRLTGLTTREAACTYSFWIIVIAVFLLTMSINGVVAHLVPMLTDRGALTATATAFLTVFGLAGIFGRLISGVVFDYIFAPYVSATVCAIALLALVLLASGAAGPAPVIAALCLGFALGAEIDIIGFLTGRYFGLKRYGAIYGYFFGTFTFASAVGPFLLGVSFDATRSYNTALFGLIIALLIAIILLTRLGPYRFDAKRSDPIGTA